MNNKSLWQRFQPHAIAIGIFLVVSCAYCLPALKGLVVNQPDVLHWKGMAQQSFEFKEKYGHFPLWTNSMFSGMPAFQISMESRYNVTIAYLDKLFKLFLPDPVGLFFLACLCFYILCMVFKLRTWVGIFGSLAYAFASYNAVIVAVGHTTKFSSMGYAPALLAGLILLTQGKYVLGFVSTLLFSTLLLYQNHIQIVYYTLITSALLLIAYAIVALREGKIRHLLSTIALAATAGILSVASYTVMLLPLYDYAKETMRGGRSELTKQVSKENKSKGGLDKDYAFLWSYGIGESLTVVLPAYKGGGSGMEELHQEGKAIEALQESQLPENAINYLYNFLSTYWGDQPNTAGPVYFGALVCMLFIAGLFLIRSWHLGWIIAATIVGFVLAWGNNLKGVNYFLFDYLPFYNKFRAPSISLVMPQLTFALLASMALQQILYGEWDKTFLLKRLKLGAITTGIVIALLTFNYFGAGFRSLKDKQFKEVVGNVISQVSGKQVPPEQINQQTETIASPVIRGLASDRKALYGSDLLRTIVFILIGSVLIWLVVRKKLSPLTVAIAFCVLTLIDLLQIDLRYLKSSNYVAKEDFPEPFAANRADLQIKQDTGYYRVFDQAGSGNPFEDSRASYHHNSVGGYHPAKLALYQDLIEHQLSKGNMAAYNMLNTKYFIVSNPSDRIPMVQVNPESYGPCWLIKTILYVNNADEEMSALDHVSVRDTVIIDKHEQKKISVTPQGDKAGSIQLLKNLNDKINYRFSSPTNQFAVFSEVYYPRGWKAFIDGKEVPIVKVDYLLRGLAVPAGNHSIEFRFEPKAYYLGDTISLIAGIISIIILAFGIWRVWNDYKKDQYSAPAKV